MLLKLPNVADPPNVVPAAVLVKIRRREPRSGNFFAQRNRFEQRAIAVAASTHVVDLSGPGRFVEFVKRANQVGAVNVVPHLLLLIAEDLVGHPCGSALHQVSEKSVQLRSRMIRPGKAAAAETRRLHAEIAAVLL